MWVNNVCLDPDFQLEEVMQQEIADNLCPVCHKKYLETDEGYKHWYTSSVEWLEVIDEIVVEFYQCSDGWYRPSKRLLDLSYASSMLINYRGFLKTFVKRLKDKGAL